VGPIIIGIPFSRINTN